MKVVASATEDEFLEVFKSDPRWPTRGWPDRRIFTGFPRNDCTWQWVTMTSDDMLQLFHIRGGRGGGWDVIAAPEYRVLDASRWLRAHPDHEVAVRVADLQEHLEVGGEVPPVIIVGTALDGELVLMDGNHRVAAAVLGGIDAGRLDVLLGTSPNMESWYFYRHL